MKKTIGRKSRDTLPFKKVGSRNTAWRKIMRDTIRTRILRATYEVTSAVTSVSEGTQIIQIFVSSGGKLLPEKLLSTLKYKGMIFFGVITTYFSACSELQWQLTMPSISSKRYVISNSGNFNVSYIKASVKLSASHTRFSLNGHFRENDYFSRLLIFNI
jgi:hypothetical protein